MGHTGQAVQPDGVLKRNFAKEAHVHLAGDLTSSANGNVPTGRHVVHTAGELIDVFVVVEANGVDSVDPLSITVDVIKNDFDASDSMLSVLPKLDKTAGSGTKNTMAAGTGITQAVMNTDGTEQVAKGDVITVDVALTRTTPDTEFNGIHVVLLFADDLVSFEY